MIIKNKITLLVAVVLTMIFCSLTIAQSQWEEFKSDHFIVYYHFQYEDFAKKVSRQAEKYYDSIAEDLGYARYSNFWKWDNRVKIYIYQNHDDYLAATGQPDWSHGIADYFKKEIVSYAWGRNFLESLLPHEMAHLIFRDFVGFKSKIPLWLDEGVAQWEEKAFRPQRQMLIKRQVKNNVLLPMKTMFELDIRDVNADEIINIQGMARPDGISPKLEMNGDSLVKLYYLQAFSLVGFLIKTYGSDNFVVFSRQLRDGKKISDALRFAYPQQLRSIEDLENKWKQYLQDY